MTDTAQTTASTSNLKKTTSHRLSRNSAGESGTQRRSSQMKSKTRISTQNMLGLSKLKLGEKSEVAVVTMAISDRSLYTSIPMTYSNRFDRKNLMKYENTYQLEPYTIFDYVEANKLIQKIVHSYIDADTRYNCLDCMDYARKISVNVKRAIKGLEIPRYKYVSVTSIGENVHQSMISVTKFLWEPEYDRFAHYIYETQFLSIYTILYAFYYN